ncbi:MAG: restriction endonuclease subunit S [Dehalococcoidia bacterium]|nr:restriction endonuclease subunit S [Dehalococcoidia bacterium]
MNRDVRHDAIRLKYAATINDEALTDATDADYELQYLDIGNVDSEGRTHDIATYRFEDAPSRARRKVKDGDTIISTVRTYLQAIASMQDPPDNLVVSTGFAVVRPVPGVFDPAYCKYAVREGSFLHDVMARSVGVSYPAINASELAAISIFLPPVDKQRTIAQYLDRETRRINDLIAVKQRLIDALAEKRRAVIAQAVTRGIDPHAPVRDSGIEWLASIPAHWGVVPLRFLVRMVSGGTPDTSEPTYWGGDVPWVSPKDMKQPEINASEDWLTTEGAESAGLRLLDPAHVLVVVRGMILAHTLPVALNTVPVTINQDMKAIRCDERLAPEFLALFLRGIAPYVLSLVTESSHGTRKLQSQVLGQLPIYVPPHDEQRTIISHVHAQLAGLDDVSAATAQTIDLLKERRAALITSVVTGDTVVRQRAH